jgi:hypothetical protein
MPLLSGVGGQAFRGKMNSKQMLRGLCVPTMHQGYCHYPPVFPAVGKQSLSHELYIKVVPIAAVTPAAP